jgi:nucleoside diphosphate kinase
MQTKNELLHIMLKPDTLESGMREVIMEELMRHGGELIANVTLILSFEQIDSVYPDFKNPRAKDAVFRYFTTKPTEHLALIGPPGINDLYQKVKGKTGTGQGIRGKYYTRYTKLTQEELALWLVGTLENAAEIDLEMFGRDILHVADCEEDSVRALRIILPSDLHDAVRSKCVNF